MCLISNAFVCCVCDVLCDVVCVVGVLSVSVCCCLNVRVFVVRIVV